MRPRHRRRPRGASRGRRRRGPRARGVRPRSVPPAAPRARPAAVRGHGGLLRPGRPVGPPDDVRHRVGPGVPGRRRRQRRSHRLPLAGAAFANSPLREGRPTGWKSARQQVWTRMDPGRTKPPPLAGDADLPAAWAAYALDAQVMCVRSDGPGDWSAPPGLRLRDWLRGSDGSAALRAPTTEDLTYHLSTLFPPVRPRGHFELRMIDAQPGDGWVVPVAVASALLSGAQAADAAMAAAERLWHPDGANGEAPWLLAASVGPAHPRIARASRECFAVARDALVRHRTPADILAAVDDFIDRYVSKDRCPADDLLEELG